MNRFSFLTKTLILKALMAFLAPLAIAGNGIGADPKLERTAEQGAAISGLRICALSGRVFGGLKIAGGMNDDEGCQDAVERAKKAGVSEAEIQEALGNPMGTRPVQAQSK